MRNEVAGSGGDLALQLFIGNIFYLGHLSIAKNDLANVDVGAGQKDVVPFVIDIAAFI